MTEERRPRQATGGGGDRWAGDTTSIAQADRPRPGMAAAPTAYARLVDALVEHGSTVKTRGQAQASATCPAHDDRNPSLSVTAVPGSVLLRCHAGCATTDVLTALGLRPADLYDDPRGRRYEYRGDDGRPVRTVYRTPDKRFRQQVHEPGVVTLYRLEAVRAAVAAGEPVWLVEGEKDADNLAALAGVAATTAPMGAANFSKVDVEPLRDARVFAVVDKDPAGDRWAADVRDHLHDVALSVEFRQAKVGKDASDHLAAGLGLDDLEVYEAHAIAHDAEGLTTLADVAPERVSWLWPDRIPCGKLTIIDGDPSTGKSTLTLDLAARVTTGVAWPDGAPGGPPGDVLLLSAEDGPGDTIRPRLDAAGADVSRVHLLEAVPLVDDKGIVRMAFPSVPRDVDHIERIVRLRRVRLLVVDVLMAYLTGDSHKDQEVRGALAPLAAMAERTGCAVIVIRHLNKSGGSNALYRGGGSIGIIGAARAAYLVARDAEDPDRRIVACEKLNIAPEPPALAYRLVSDDAAGVAHVEWEPDALTGVTAASLLHAPDEDERSERDEAAEWLAGYVADNGGEALAAHVRKESGAVGLSWRTVQRARERAGVESSRRGSRAGGFGGCAPKMPRRCRRTTPPKGWHLRHLRWHLRWHPPPALAAASRSPRPI